MTNDGYKILKVELLIGLVDFFDIGGLPHALGSVTAVFNGVPSCYLPYRRFRRYAAAPPSIPLAALSGSKIRQIVGSRVVLREYASECEPNSRARAAAGSPG